MRGTENITRDTAKQNKFYLVYIALFICLLTTGGIAFLVLPHKKTSDVERRELASFPKFSTDGFWKGEFMQGIDMYVADNFALREHWMEFSMKLEDWRGIKNEKEAFYEAEPMVEDEPEQIEKVVKDTASTLQPKEEFPEEKVEKNKGLLIYNNRALQVFGGNSTMAKAYADAINSYVDDLKDVVNIYVTVVPSAGEFYMPQKYSHLKGREKENIEQIYSFLNDYVRPVDAYSVLKAHEDEYLYFRTDHHWTGLAAYYAYTAWCKKAKVKPIALNEMDHKEIPGFYGSLYAQTRDPKLAEKPDTVHYWKVPGNHNTTKFIKTNQFKEVAGALYAESARGMNSYSVFLGADWPLMVCKTPLNNGRRAIIVKNSYGNPFATYFSAHFETLLILDYRYCERGISSLIKEYGITDLIFINGAFSANTGYHIQRIRRMLHATTGKVILEKRPTETDSTGNVTGIDSLQNLPDRKDTIKP